MNADIKNSPVNKISNLNSVMNFKLTENGSRIINDSSINKSTGDLGTTTEWIAGTKKSALNFDNTSNSRITTTYKTNNDFLSRKYFYLHLVFVTHAPVSGIQIPVNNYDGVNNFVDNFIENRFFLLDLNFEGSGVLRVQTTFTLTTNLLYSIVIGYDHDDGGFLFVNGNKGFVSTTMTSGLTLSGSSNNITIRIGGHQFNTYDGTIESISLGNRKLSQFEKYHLSMYGGSLTT